MFAYFQGPCRLISNYMISKLAADSVQKKVLRQTIKLQTDGNYWSLMFNYINVYPNTWFFTWSWPQTRFKKMFCDRHLGYKIILTWYLRFSYINIYSNTWIFLTLEVRDSFWKKSLRQSGYNYWYIPSK